jgi:hypothetical protein
MSLYREPGGRALRAAALGLAAGLLLGLAAGLLVSGGEEEPPSVRAALDSLRERVRPATAGLELVGIEYPQSVRGGRVIAPTEYAATQAHVRRARTAVAAARPDLVALDRAATGRLLGALDELGRLIAGRAPPPRVVAAAGAAERLLREITG